MSGLKIQEDVMQVKRNWAVLRSAILAMGVAAISTVSAQASTMSGGSGSGGLSPLLTYDTLNSSIGSTGITGTPAINFVPVTGVSYLSPSNLSFGSFQVSALPTGQSTTYVNTPVSINFTADSVNGQPVNPNQTPITISGVLNGTITGANQSSVIATFAPPSKSVFQTGLYSNTLSSLDSPLRIAPSSSGSTTAQGLITATTITAAVPEPSTIAVFAVMLAGLGLRQRGVLRRRNTAAA